jgi:hypothetical protein
VSKLIGDRHHLELQAAEIKNELFHLKKALRVTQDRIRCINTKIDRAQRGPALALVTSGQGSS